MQSSKTRGLAGLLAVAALAASAAPAARVVRGPVPQIATHWQSSNRTRAQWKNETNKRGRNR